MASSKVNALIIMDMTKEFCDPTGTLPTTKPYGSSEKGCMGLVDPINKLLDMPGFSLKVSSILNIPGSSILFADNHPAGTTEVGIPNILETATKVIGGLSKSIGLGDVTGDAASTIKTRMWPKGGNPNTEMGQMVKGIDQSKIDETVLRGNDENTLMHSALGDVHGNPASALLSKGVVSHDLGAMLKERNVTDIYIVGTAGDHCVPHTAWDCAKLKYNTYILEDVIANIYPDNTEYEKCKEKSLSLGVKYIKMESPEVQAVAGSKA